jgi:hypothetical protein
LLMVLGRVMRGVLFGIWLNKCCASVARCAKHREKDVRGLLHGEPSRRQGSGRCGRQLKVAIARRVGLRGGCRDAPARLGYNVPACVSKAEAMLTKTPVDRLRKFIELFREKGLGYALKASVWFFRYKYNLIRIDPVLKRRIAINERVDNLFSSTVAYGPFKGLKFTDEYWWGKTDRASMILGLYEQELLDALRTIGPAHRIFIDLGAADGYYAIGVLVNGLFYRSYCFEMSERAREALRANAEKNGVADRVIIRAAASREFYKDLPQDILSKSVILVDIEGAEFDLLTSDVFAAFAGSIILIESHDYFFANGQDKLDRLKVNAGQYFNITEITTTSRDLSRFPELRSFSDTDRWLICDEGRGQLMTWLRLDPS